jgi:hypothetical protein
MFQGDFECRKLIQQRFLQWFAGLGLYVEARAEQPASTAAHEPGCPLSRAQVKGEQWPVGAEDRSSRAFPAAYLPPVSFNLAIRLITGLPAE